MNTLIYPHSETALAQPLRARSTTKYTQRITPVQMLQLTSLMSLGQVYLQLAGRLWQRRLPQGPQRGQPIVYADLTIWLTAVIQRLWQKSDEGIIRYLRAQPSSRPGRGR